MKPGRLSLYFASFLFLIAAGCLDPYTPPASADTQRNFLVVDGFVNTGNKSAEVKLSMAVPLGSATSSSSLTKAAVQIEGTDGTIIALPETTKGVYSATSINVENGKKYNLRVKTSGNEYISDMVEMKRSPVLDSVNWRPGPTGITIYVDSHDVQGSTKYYQWNFTEVWEYNAEKFSEYIWDKSTTTPIQRHAGQYIYVCYATQASTRVLITSTISNSLDVVNDFPLTFIPKGSKKVSRLYSILVQQRAMDEQAYTFWKNLQRSTESVGGLFDAMPSEVTGNVHNVKNSSEEVLGYFSGGEVQEKRIFIDWEDMPLDLHVVDHIECENDSIRVGSLPLYNKVDLYIVNAWGTPSTIGYVASEGICVDCRLSGGVLAKPSFWPR